MQMDSAWAGPNLGQGSKEGISSSWQSTKTLPEVQAGHREASEGAAKSNVGCVEGLSPLTPGGISYSAKRLVNGAICLLLQHIVGLVDLLDKTKLLLQ